MVGITSIGAYIPRYRLSRQEIGKMWQARVAPGERSVAGYDEDAITMAVAASLECMRHNQPDGLYLATTTAPYKEKQGAAIVASATDIHKRTHTTDFTNTLRAATAAMKAAIDAVKGGSAKGLLVVASESRMGAPKGRFEQTIGDGAAAIMIGEDAPLAIIEGSHSVFSDFTDLWRTEEDRFIQSGEGRFIEEAGYMPIMTEAINELMVKYSFTPRDFTKAVFYAPDNRNHANLAKALGFQKGQVQDTLFDQIGNTGTVAALIMLISALEEAAPGDRILFVCYGDGADAFILRITENISRIKCSPSMKDRLAASIPIDYGRYLLWRDLIPTETSNLPERPEASLAARWREQRHIMALYGYRCKRCATPQIHPLGQRIRVCCVCQTKDEFEDYRFSDKKGRLFTYAIDHLQPTKNPPGLNGVVDFEGGGRLICELTDYDLDKVSIGMPVEMTFRRLSYSKGIVNYFWKAKPLRGREGHRYGDH
jgi:3-hydroxy-3-methylglutaryl CoA synthase